MIHITKELASQLETAEALNQVEFTMAHQRLTNRSIATYQKIGSGYAVFAGVDSPLTQCFGLGFDGEAQEEQVIALESFFHNLGAPVNIEVCHLADLNLTRILIDRGYKISEYSNVLIRLLKETDTFELSSGKEIRQILDQEINLFSTIVSRGFLETDEVPASFYDMFQVFFRQNNCGLFGAFVDGVAAGGGAIFMQGDVAALGGASTLVEFRNQGIQSDLIRKRLEYARSKGCTMAMVTTLPGSVSQKNVEKCGFQVAYARSKFFLNPISSAPDAVDE